MYYFDAWSTQSLHSWAGAVPWINKNAGIDMRIEYPDREPLLGWYDQADPGIVAQQVAWMIDYGIDFIVFEVFYESWAAEQQKIRPTVGLSKYLELPRRGEIDFAILWCYGSQYNFPEDKPAWDRMVNYWLDNYLLKPEYKRIDGKPVIFILNNFIQRAVDIGFASSSEMLDRAKELAAEKGLKGLYFVVCITPLSDLQDRYDDAMSTGFDALTAYNWPVKPDYKATMNFYKGGWQRILNMPKVASGQVPLIVPLLSGFDNRAWGHDYALPSTPDQFEEHLIDGRSFILANPKQTMRTAVICAWNEHGEGSVVEPTKKFGFEYLDRIMKVFGRAKKTVKPFDYVKYYPNPIQPSKGPNYSKMNFVHMPAGTHIKIYTMLGQVVRDLETDASGAAVWDGKNNAGEKVASGVYIVYMKDVSGNEKRIKVAVER